MAMTASSSRGKQKTATKNIPAFLNKLFAMVNDPATNDLILWSDKGDSFYVPSPDKFGRELLPRFFKHSNFGSFVRQLNMYGFHKVPHLSHGVLKTDSEDGTELQFSNPNFARGQPDLLCHIHRQKSRADNPASHLPDTELALDLPTLLTDLAAVRKHQSALTTDLAALEKSNRALWEEAIQSRERQKGHQETITKILRFLGTVFGGAQANAGAAKGTTASNVTEEVQDRGREGNDKGKGKEVSVQRRSRLLLEDVKERRDARAREMQIAEEDADYEEEDDDTIEEIGSQGNFTPITTASKYVAPRSNVPSTNPYPALPPLPSEQPSRFSDYLDPVLSDIAPPSADSQYELAPDMLSSLLSPSNSNTLAAFMQLQNNGGLVSPPILSSYAQKYPTTTTQGTKYDPTNGVNNLILPSPTPHPSSSTSTNYLNQLSPRTLATLLPSLPPSSTLPEDYTQSINDHAEVLQDVQNEKADLDERTSALENAIEKLMNGLPVETRDALSGPGAVTAGTVQEGEAMAAGLDWGAIGASDGDLPVVGNEGEMDLDSFLAQYSNQATETPDYSYLFDPTSPSAIRLPAPPSAIPPPVPSYLLPLNSATTSPSANAIIEALSPSITNSDSRGSRSSSLGPAIIAGGLRGADEDWQESTGGGKKVGGIKKKATTTKGGTKKRKSESRAEEEDDDEEWGSKVSTKRKK